MWRSRLIAFGFGLLGVTAALLGYHLWTDHVALHTVIDFLNQHAAKIATSPAP